MSTPPAPSSRPERLIEFVLFTLGGAFLAYLGAALSDAFGSDRAFAWEALFGDGSLFLVAVGLASGAVAQAMNLTRGAGKSLLVGFATLCIACAALGYGLGHFFVQDERVAAAREAAALHAVAQEDVNRYKTANTASGAAYAELLLRANRSLEAANVAFARAQADERDDDETPVMVISLIAAFVGTVVAVAAALAE